MTKSSVEKYYLPEVSSLLALYLRQSTGDQHIFARVILPTDKDSTDPDRPYISIGICVHGCEDEQFVLSPPDKGTDWSLTGIYACALVTPSLAIILAKMAEIIFKDRLIDIHLSFQYDRSELLNGAP